MRYRVAFKKRLESNGQESELDPTQELDGELTDGVVAEKVFVERLESDADHGEETLDEDDAFLGSASTEVWEYEIVDGRDQEFRDAIVNSHVVFEYLEVDDSGTTSEDTSSDVQEKTAPSSPQGALEDLTVVKAEPPQLGLTNPEDSDWASDTGPTRNPADTVTTRGMTDKSSTLGRR